MRHLKFVVLLLALFIMTNCENKEKSVLVNLTVNAKIELLSGNIPATVPHFQSQIIMK